jgi:electron transfer flavoprotein beta subunit
VSTNIVVVRAQAALYEEFDVVDHGGHIDPDYLSFHLGNSDAAAVEAAGKLGGLTVAVAVGGGDSDPALYEALALGASQAVRIDTGKAESDPLVIARLLTAFISTQNAGLVFCGATSSDHGDSAVPGAIAGYLGWVQVPHVTRVQATDQTVVVLRETGDDSAEELSVNTPAVISVRPAGPAQILPNYNATLSAVHQPIHALGLDELGLTAGDVDSTPTRLVRLTKPTPTAAVQLTGSPSEVSERILSIIAERIR